MTKKVTMDKNRTITTPTEATTGTTMLPACVTVLGEVLEDFPQFKSKGNEN